MNLKDILKLALVGATIYVAYKYGENRDIKSSTNNDEKLDDSEEINYIQNIISSLQSKPNKTKKDRNNIELLEVKLKQLSK